MKTLAIIIMTIITSSATFAQEKYFYDFTVKTIDGKDFPLSSLKGKKVLIVNVASKYSFTLQYVQLQKLYSRYSKDNFLIIGFSANNFLH